MLLKKTHLLKIKDKIKEVLDTYNSDLNKEILNLKKEHEKKIKELETRIETIEKHNKLIVSDTFILAQNMSNLFAVVGEHNDIINEEIAKKNIIYH